MMIVETKKSFFFHFLFYSISPNQIRLASDELSFDFMPDVTSNVTNPIKIPIESATKWHAVELSYKNGEIKFTVDYRKSLSKMFGLSLTIGHKVIIGSSLRSEYTKITKILFRFVLHDGRINIWEKINIFHLRWFQIVSPV